MSNSRPSHRRDFLTGKAGRNARDSGLKAASSPVSSRPLSDAGLGSEDNARSRGYWEQYSKNAMGCEFEFFFNLAQYPQASGAVVEACQLIDDLEETLSVFREESEINRINQLASREDVPIGKWVMDVLIDALEIYRQTDGAFDITAGRLTRLWRFDRKAGRLPEADAIAQTLEAVGSEFIKLTPSPPSVRLTRSGVSINLGGIGKGYALDCVADQLETMGVHDFVIHGGQSSVLARGAAMLESPDHAPAETHHNDPDQAEPQPSPLQGWRIGVSHPTLPSERLADIRLCNQALGTSGTARQGFFARGKRYGHIIDPRTGWPSSHILSSTVIAPTAARADALATAFFVMTVEEVEAYCQAHPEVAALLVLSTRKTGETRIVTFNLPDEAIRFSGS